MERIVKVCLTVVLSGIIGAAGSLWAYGEERESSGPEELHARSAVLADGETGRILWEENGDEPMAMASTTKIMTCLLALENSEMNEVVEISEYAASMPDVQLDAVKGDHFYMEDLLYALMLESYNDVAVAIAEHIGGSVEGFAAMMNERAKALGCEQTNFVTPNGLDAEGHQTTAAELAKISVEAIKNTDFVNIINTLSRSFTNVDGNRSYQVNNRDSFLHMMDGAFGIKTGFTGDAGYCFAGALKRDERTYISVVLGSGWPPNKNYKWQDTKALMTYGLEQYTKARIGSEKLTLGKIRVRGGAEKEVSLKVDSETKEILLGKAEAVSIDRVQELSLDAPVTAGQEVGRLYYRIDGKTVDVFPIYVKEAVPEKDLGFCLREVIRAWIAF